MIDFPSSYSAILDRIDQIDPVTYGRTRNFKDGAVSYLSPYISRGVISTRFVMERLIEKGHSFSSMQKFLQELTWRDYWQQIWNAVGDDINDDLKSRQQDVNHDQLSLVIDNAATGIEVIDQGISDLKKSGYMHNHMRMYVASIACNIGKGHWREPARWMYYHLFDGDWASNALSWQWVAGTNANKKYIANQENINKYFHSDQRRTFLDVSYEELTKMDCPEPLRETFLPELKTELPWTKSLQIDPSLPTLIYNYYNLDPSWRKEFLANRILLFEPEVFEKYPVSNQCMEFVLSLTENLPGIQVFTGSFSDLKARYELNEIFFKQHPLNKHYEGTEDPREWMSSVEGYYDSFFKFWKYVKKELKLLVPVN